MKSRFHIVLAVILTSLPLAASADILEWTDNAGVTHYTNLKAEVPSQQAVQVVVDEQVWVPRGPAEPDEKRQDPVAPPQPPPLPEDEVSRAYVAGVESGLARNVSTGGSVYIAGPLAVTIASPSSPTYVQPGADWLLPGYSPFLTTAVVERPRGPERGRGSPGNHGRSPVFPRSPSAAGPPPIGAAGPPPIGAAGRPPVGAAGGLRTVSGGRSLW